MRVLFADNLPESCVQGATDAGYECTIEAGLTADDLPRSIPGYDVVVVRSTKVTAATIEAGDALGLVIRAGAGTNTIDIEAAANAAVQVANVPGQNAIAVAELAMGLLLAIDRRIVDGVIDSRAGKWDKKTYSKGRGVFGRTIGVVGIGSIGMAVVERARAFGMNVVVVAKPGRSPERVAQMETLGVREVGSLSELVQASDVVSFHVPASADTKGLLNAEVLADLRPGAIVINTSRGDTIDEAALLAAIEEKDLWVGLDVYPDEPSSAQGDFDSALASHPRVYGTHHIGASTQQAQEAVGDGVVDILRRYAAGTEIPTVVNLAAQGATGATLVVRHKNRVGVLSDIFVTLRSAGLNVEDMANRIFAGGDAALATIHLGGVLDEDVADQVQAIEHVLSISIS